MLRSPRFPPGWWIIPGTVIGACLWMILPMVIGGTLAAGVVGLIGWAIWMHITTRN